LLAKIFDWNLGNRSDLIFDIKIMSDGSSGGGPDKWRTIESEMDRFEAEISSLASVKPAFIPASVRKTVIPSAPKPTPVIISGAPQVYRPAGPIGPGNGFPTASSTTITRPAFIPRHVRPSLIPGAPQITTGPGGGAPSTAGPAISVQQQTPGTATSGENAKFVSIIGAHKPGSEIGDQAATTSTSFSTAPLGSLAGDDKAKPSTSAGTGSEASGTTKTAKKKAKKKVAEGEKKQRKHIRSAGGTIWEDPTLLDWDPSDFRLFCGDLGNDVTDEVLTRVFGRYPSFQKAKVVRDKRTNKTRGYGFVSFKDPNDFVRAIRELDGRYVGSRPIKLRKSNWKNRTLGQVRKREKEQRQFLGIKKPK
jgi:hypothetical protein